MTAPVDPVDKAEASLLAKEPTLITWGSGIAVAAAGGWLFTHFGTDADTTKQFLEPALVVVGGSVFAWVNRSVVTPTATFAKKVEAEVRKRLPGA